MNEIDDELIQVDKEIEIAEKLNDLQGLSFLYSNKGKILFNQGNYKNSLEYLKKSSKISIKENSPHLFASNIYTAGLCYEGLKDFTNAKGAFKLALIVSKKIDNRDIGKKSITKLIEINKLTRKSPPGNNEGQKKAIPKNFGFFHLLTKGSQEFGKRNYRETINILNELNKLNPNYFGSWLLLVECYLKLNDPQMIILSSKKALSIKEIGYFWGTLGDGYYLQKDFKKANKYFKKAIKITDRELLKNPQDEVLFNTIGWYLIKLGKYEESIKYSEEALKINPKSEHHLHNIGLAHYNMENFQKAIEYFEKALEIDNTHSYSLYDLGCTYEKLKMDEKALEYFENAVKYDPQWVKLRLKLLKLKPDSPYLSIKIPEIPDKFEKIKKEREQRNEIKEDKNPLTILKNLKDTSSKLLEMDKKIELLKLMNLEHFVEKTRQWADDFLDFLQKDSEKKKD